MNPLIDMDPLYQLPTHGIFKIRLRKSMHGIRRFNINHLWQLVHSLARALWHDNIGMINTKDMFYYV